MFYLKEKYLYFSIGNGQPREPTLCQLYRHTFVPYVCRSLFSLTSSVAWRRCGVVVSGVRHMNEVNQRRARLVPGWVNVSRRVHHLGM